MHWSAHTALTVDDLLCVVDLGLIYAIRHGGFYLSVRKTAHKNDQTHIMSHIIKIEVENRTITTTKIRR